MTFEDISVPISKLSLVDFLLINPCENPANKSPAPVKSLILRLFLAEHSTISFLFIAMHLCLHE